jgi:hypothetical protein
MDPLASISEYRQQEHAQGRSLKVAPPPTIPVPPPADTAPADTAPADTAPADTAVELDPAAGGPPEAKAAIGMARGRKRLIHVYLPGDTAHRLDAARHHHGTLGAAVMAALRGSFDWIMAHHTPEPRHAVGPFPIPRAPRRRLAVDDPRLKPFYVDPDEAGAIDTLADQLELSVSELVTIALDHWYGEATTSP